MKKKAEIIKNAYSNFMKARKNKSSREYVVSASQLGEKEKNNNEINKR